MSEILNFLEGVWNSLPSWIQNLLLVLLGATGATLLSFYKDTLLGFLKSLSELLQSLGSTRWKDRAFEKEYVDWIIAKHQDLKLVGVQAQAKLPLEEVFVSLRIAVDHSKYPSKASIDSSGGSMGNEELEEERTLTIGELARSAQKAVILGNPGAGKTTLLQYIALTFAREKASEKKFRRRGIVRGRLGIRQWRLPVFVPLRGMTGMEKLENWPILLQLSPHLKYPVGYFERQLEQGRCILLLDGLDEARTVNDHKLIAKAISDLASPPYSDNQFVVTCRIAGWKDLLSSDFARVEVKDFGDAEIEQFVKYWYDAVERSMVVGRETESERKLREARSSERANDLLSALSKNTRVRRLARNPLLLSIIAIVHRAKVVLPRQRAKLYRDCVELLLEQWDMARGIQIDDTGLSLDQKMAIMRAVANDLQVSGEPQASREQVEKIVAEQLNLIGKTALNASNLLRLLEERSGLIIEKGPEILSFAHLTFQEYFSAQAVAQDPSKVKELLSPQRLFDPKWREVVLLYVGIVEDATDFIEAVYSPNGEDIFLNHLRLAVRSLNDAVKVSPPLRVTLIRKVLAAYHDAPFQFLRKELNEVIRGIDSEELKSELTGFLQAEFSNPYSATPKKEARDSTRTIDDIISQLHSSDVQMRLRAVDALAEINSLADSSEGFLQALQDSNLDIRRKAITVIGETRRTNQKILDTITKAAEDSDWQVRQRAMRALGKIAQLSPEAMRVLIRGLKDSQPLVPPGAAAALGELGQGTDEVKAGLMQALSAPSEPLQVESARALIKMGQADQVIFDKLAKLLQHKDWAIRMAAVEILGHAESAQSNTSIVQQVINCVSDSQWQIRYYALDCLSRWHYDRLEAKQPVISRLSDEKKEVRNHAILTLVSLGYNLTEVFDKLCAMLADEDAEVRARAVQVVGTLALQQSDLLATLIKMSNSDASPLVRAMIAETMGNWKMNRIEVIDTLIAMLQDTDVIDAAQKRVQDSAYEALFRICESTGTWIGKEQAKQLSSLK